VKSRFLKKSEISDYSDTKEVILQFFLNRSSINKEQTDKRSSRTCSALFWCETSLATPIFRKNLPITKRNYRDIYSRDTPWRVPTLCTMQSEKSGGCSGRIHSANICRASSTTTLCTMQSEKSGEESASQSLDLFHVLPIITFNEDHNDRVRY